MLDGFHGEIEGPVGDLLYAEGVQKGVREGPIGGLEHSGGRHAAKGGPGLGVGLAHDTGHVMSAEPVERDAAPLGQELPWLDVASLFCFNVN
jgi:hypothetical protein